MRDGIKRRIGGRIYKLWNTFPTKPAARNAAKDLRTKQGRLYPYNMTLARVIEIGRQRYGVFVRKSSRAPI